MALTKATVLTDRFDRALMYATHVHGGQVRKATSIPYIARLLAVAATVLEYGGDEDLAIAALLHDARAILRDLRKQDVGEKIWSRFSQPKEQTLWYYRSLADTFCERLPGQLSDELREIVRC
jgi:hypothetical protein